MQLTAGELWRLEEQLAAERVLIQKFSAYARMTQDPQLRTQFELCCARHQSHFRQLYAKVGEGTV